MVREVVQRTSGVAKTRLPQPQLHIAVIFTQLVDGLTANSVHIVYFVRVDRDMGAWKVPLERIIKMLTMDTARLCGLTDRGQIAVGLRYVLLLLSLYISYCSCLGGVLCVCQSAVDPSPLWCCVVHPYYCRVSYC